MSNIKLEGLEKEIVNTYDGIKDKILLGRMCGNTSRQVDYAIDLLFKGKIVKCVDHYSMKFDADIRASMRCNDDLLNRIVRRLNLEYRIDEKSEVRIKIDNNKKTISLEYFY